MTTTRSLRLAGVFLLALSVLGLAGCAQRNFAGTWNGTVSVNAPTGQKVTLPLTFHVTKKDDGTYTATVDVTSFKMTGLPVQSFVVDKDNVTFTLAAAAGTFNFTGTSNAAATEITGKMATGTDSTPLTLSKAPDAK